VKHRCKTQKLKALFRYRCESAQF